MAGLYVSEMFMVLLYILAPKLIFNGVITNPEPVKFTILELPKWVTSGLSEPTCGQTTPILVNKMESAYARVIIPVDKKI